MPNSFVIDITCMNSEGCGVGSLDGMKIFVPGAFPEDRVEIVINQRFRNYAVGIIKRIIVSSPFREIPLCSLSNVCGGCSLMGLSYAKQLLLKRERVFSAMRKFSGIEFDIPLCKPSPEDRGYRNKLDFSIDLRNQKLGFYCRGTSNLVDIPYCFLQDEELNSVLTFIRSNIGTLPNCSRLIVKKCTFSGKVLICFATKPFYKDLFVLFSEKLVVACPFVSGIVLNFRDKANSGFFSDNWFLVFGEDYLLERLLGSFFKIRSENFFQVNIPQAENLFGSVINMVEPNDVLDGFCGIGTLSVLLRNKCKKIIGVESSFSSIRSAKENAILNKADNCSFICGKLENIFHKLPNFRTVILNPPRNGCARNLIFDLLQKKPEKIIIISCHPESLARDISLLSEYYSLKNFLLFDMFPQTMHVESVVELVVKNYKL